MPTGWWVIGRTPVRMFSQVRDPIFLVQIGDLVRFKSIDKEEFDSFEQRSTSGELVAEREMLR
jgi:allophanate hydrolase subunit 1